MVKFDEHRQLEEEEEEEEEEFEVVVEEEVEGMECCGGDIGFKDGIKVDELLLLLLLLGK